MSSTSPNEDANTTSEANFFYIPKKFSWETESHCDEFTQEIPTYSWEFDTCSPIHTEDSTSTIVPDSQWSPNIHHIPKLSWESASQCDKYTKDIPTYSCEDDSCTPKNEDGFGFPNHKYDNQAECPDPKRVVKAVQPYQFTEPSDTYGGSTSNECKDQYYDFEFAQSPEKPNLNLDVDAIKSELCDGFIDSPPKDHYYDFEFAQSPDKPNINLDVDAIKSELCDGFVDSPQKKKKGKNITKWF